jgi:hypothetical protein
MSVEPKFSAALSMKTERYWHVPGKIHRVKVVRL